MLQECTFRKVWEDDGNVQRVEVEQSATAFFKTIYTRMHVVQVTLATRNYLVAVTMLTQDPQMQPTGSSVGGHCCKGGSPAWIHCKTLRQSCQFSLAISIQTSSALCPPLSR